MANGAAELIWQLWNAGEVINDLPFDLKPRTRAQGYAVQAQFAGMSKRPLFGWKVAATSKAGQEHIGVSGPIAGRILAERAFEDGDELVFGANRMRVAEPEFAFRFGKALQPRRKEYTMEDVLDAVATLHPSIEVPDSRFDNFATVGEAQLIADNACAHEFVLGPATDTNWRAIDLSQHKASAEVVGGEVHDGIGSNVLGDPREALLWLVKEVMNLGYTIEAGQVVTTGTCAEPLDIEPGNEVIADFGDLGQVSISFDG
ncbi:MAG: hydratase [Rickettsiales bacterium]|nr:hydratase [Rickettsiales bacterium]|tara:strand:- start:43 stop:819 length:777 start_codon:yes stop_codon:yes gene_type:complete